MDDDFRTRMADVKTRLAELRRTQKGLAAHCQQIATALQAAMADDWEARYVAEGFAEMEQYVNEDRT